jgi:hypothetical protein
VTGPAVTQAIALVTVAWRFGEPVVGQVMLIGPASADPAAASAIVAATKMITESFLTLALSSIPPDRVGPERRHR